MVLLTFPDMAVAQADPIEHPAVSLAGVGKVYGSGATAITAVSDILLDIRPNEFFTLLGPSGCGKTTLLRMIAGFEFPTEGNILLGGTDITDLPPYRRPVNTVFQSYALFPHMTVEENVSFGLRMQGHPRSDIATRVDAMLALVRLEALRDRRIDQLSGGQQQRVALARALAPRPQVLLLDEPFSALDYKLRKEMQSEIKRMQHETGITFIFVTHDQEEALAMSDRIAVMSAGRVLQVGTPGEIYNRPANRFVADFIGDANVIAGRVLSFDGETARVRLDCGGVVQAAARKGTATCTAVEVMIRPEACTLTPLPRDEDDHLPGVLTSVTYLGSDIHYLIALGGGLAHFSVRLRAVPQVGPAAAPGTALGIRVAPGGALVLAP